ncbi:MAG TPA: lysophospholipid acyltransferase family protein [Polyangiaceae bacterium LLY-WYZ-15_(1-7)]|nr:lysophospholipid acyltransferase family protein [Polyangiaceae bacterium LLY-WYZ-15_(1-7)]HJL06433.1 lysophospholipid acyltransferase family protein [Polyangiaceae bacterium LLY-WYZ-15_(1-7)]HJL09913.1 lysophospholipid acyltransferase family protein [Polyangiaceae bacterium LLY-WYZ-15_(1-7)]
MSDELRLKDVREPRLIRESADVLEPLLWRWFDPTVRGLDAIPEGPALYVSNHSGGFVSPDTWILSIALLRERGVEFVPHGLAHDVVIRAPILGRVLRRLGGVPASHEGAHQVFAHGDKVLVYPGGDIDAFRASRQKDRVVFGPRRGYVRLALREGVPIVPVVVAGAHEGWWVLSDGRKLARALGTHRFLRTDVLPITLSLPWGLVPGAPPYLPLPTRILIEVLPPMRFERAGPEAADDRAYVERCHERIEDAMQRVLDRLVLERRARGPVRPFRSP